MPDFPTDEISATFPCHVRKNAGMLLHAPATRLVCEVDCLRLRRLECAVGASHRDEHVIVAEGDNVSAAVPVDVCEQAQMLLHTPARLVTEIGEHRLGLAEV